MAQQTGLFIPGTGTMPTTPPIIVTAMRPRRSLRKRPHKAEQARRCPKAEYGLPDTIMSHDRDIEAAATISLRGNHVRCHASHMAMLRYQAQHMFCGFVCAMCCRRGRTGKCCPAQDCPACSSHPLAKALIPPPAWTEEADVRNSPTHLRHPD
jgi:hypothetical protein